MKRVSRRIDRMAVTFDDPNLVADAGLLLVASLVPRLGLEELTNARVRLVGRIGGAAPGRKVLRLVHRLIAGGSHIDHADILRSGATQEVLSHRVMAPSTLGTFLRAFTFGHVRQLEAVVGQVAGPGVVNRRRSGNNPAGDRRRLDHLRSLRQGVRLRHSVMTSPVAMLSAANKSVVPLRL